MQDGLIDEISLVTVPAAEPSGQVVPLFQIGKYQTGRYDDSLLLAERSNEIRRRRSVADLPKTIIQKRIHMYNFVFQNTTKIYFGENQLGYGRIAESRADCL